MASLIIFLCFAAFMFFAGYQWRKIREFGRGAISNPATSLAPREIVWDGMISKL